jgi:L-ascorbate metabolism protein UlaG (beta-lactamase superfamily)
MIEPALRDDALLADVRQSSAGADGFRLWWLGQSGFLVQWHSKHLLLDPYLSDSLTRKYANTDKPHVRLTTRAVAPDRLDFVDVVTSSHNHTDHLDAETLVPLLRVNPEIQLVIPEANRQFVIDRLAGAALDHLAGLDAGHSVTLAGFKITAIPAAHETVDKDEQGRCRYLGYVIEFGPWTLYHSGDTVWYDEMVAWLRRWTIDVMLLPINGRNPARRVAGNLDGREAARLAHEAGARLVIPCHFEMFEFNTASPEEFVQAAGELDQPCRVLRCGDPWGSGDLGI